MSGPARSGQQELEVVARRVGDADLDALLAEAVAELARRYPEDTDALEEVEGAGLKPSARYLVALVGGEPAGCIALVPVDEEPAGELVEMKRVYVREAHRGRGVARALVAALEDAARAGGARRVRLETGTRQPEAVALYERLGYERTPNFGPWADSPLSVCYARDL
ncbi:GNAT family N-acetyltransferase [Kineococcus terrestris]|uniref:GNAT family N-acetyltransferase n=1 Tax=Kineococcus terrestris TaxID=2044856 RepID=UPI0034DB1712